MTGYRLTFLTLLLMLSCGISVAQNYVESQNFTNSPYTRYGYGQLTNQGSSNSQAMGGVAYGLRDNSHINFANPASYTAVDSLTFIFDGGFNLQNTNFSDGTVKRNAKNAGFDFITLQFRLAKWMGVSMGILPYSNIGYNMTEYRDEQANSMVEYSGNGGLHQLYFGAAFKLFKNFSIGANASLLWGNITHLREMTFPYNSTAFPVAVQTSADLKSYKVDIGAQYTINFGRKHSITLGGVFSPGHDLVGTTIETRQTGSSSTGSITSSQREFEGVYGIPTSWGAGFSYVYDRRLTIAADYTQQNWADANFSGSKDVLCDRQKVSVGAEFIPNLIGRTYLSYVRYRIGAYYDLPYYKIDGLRTSKEYGISAGFGFPVPLTRSIVSVTGQYVHTKRTNAAFLDEKTLRICIGITFNERWFFKRKVE